MYKYKFRKFRLTTKNKDLYHETLKEYYFSSDICFIGKDKEPDREIEVVKEFLLKETELTNKDIDNCSWEIEILNK